MIPAPVSVGLLAINVVSTLAFLCYTAVGIDVLSERYIGYFYFSAPLITLLVIAVSLTEAVPLGALAAPAAALLAVISFAAAPATAANTGDTDAALPGVVSAVAASAHGKTIVIDLDPTRPGPMSAAFWSRPSGPGCGCARGAPGWTFMMTRQFICTPGQILTGAPFWFRAPAAPPGAPVIATLKNSAGHGGRGVSGHTQVRTAQSAPPRVRAAWPPAVLALVIAALFFLYLRQSLITPMTSDGAANALQAQSMLHGNLLLHHWWVSDVSFYPTELSQYALIEVVLGLSPVGGARGRGHDLHAARGALGPARQGQRPG